MDNVGELGERIARVEENTEAILAEMKAHKAEHGHIYDRLLSHDRELATLSTAQKLMLWVGGTLFTIIGGAVVALVFKVILGAGAQVTGG